MDNQFVIDDTYYKYDRTYIIKYNGRYDLDSISKISNISVEQVINIATECGGKICTNIIIRFISFKDKSNAERCVEQLNAAHIMNKLVV